MFRHHRTSLISNRSFVSDLRIYRPSRVSYFYLQTIVLFKGGVGVEPVFPVGIVGQVFATSRSIIQLGIVAKDTLLVEGHAPLGRGMRTGKRLDCRQLVFLTIGPATFYLSAFLKILTALSASAALSKAK